MLHVQYRGGITDIKSLHGDTGEEFLLLQILIVLSMLNLLCAGDIDNDGKPEIIAGYGNGDKF